MFRAIELSDSTEAKGRVNVVTKLEELRNETVQELKDLFAIRSGSTIDVTSVGDLNNNAIDARKRFAARRA